MKRLYYLTDSVDCVEQISSEVHRWGISDWNFHVLSKDRAGLSKHQNHTDTPLHQKSIIPTGERSAFIGVAAGIAAALGASLLIPLLDSVGRIPFAIMVFICALFGAWSIALFGIHEEQQKLRKFQGDIESGKYLIMVDVKKDQIELVRKVMDQHPEALPARMGGSVSNFLASAK
ncbi:MAG: hypothetical protein ACR2P1_29145 [Pseudomonadales bacterium]